jgi:hypothetical protein
MNIEVHADSLTATEAFGRGEPMATELVQNCGLLLFSIVMPGVIYQIFYFST